MRSVRGESRTLVGLPTSPPGPHRKAERVALSNCKLCPASIRPGQAWVWLSKPMGISHVECVDRASPEEIVR
jgi:hypothetical protein